MGIPIADAPNIEIIYGQAGSGKTEEAVRRYAECVSDHGEDAALLIVPTARVVRQVRERLVDEGRPPGLVDPRIFTFPQLAQIILNANHECATPIGGAMQRLLIGEVIDSLIADGELVELADVARLPGFAVALMELVSDLKRGAVEPRPFCHALAQAGLNETWRGEISKLYCAYQWMLICLRYFDDEGVFWWARGVLRDGGRRPLEQTRLMVVDGFTDFTTTQLQMLQLLAEGIPRTVVTLDYAEHDEREGLAQWFGDTVERVRDHLPGAAIHPLPGGIAPNALGHLRGTVFSPPGKVEPVPADGRVHVLDCPTRFREVREVLRRVKGLLVEGQASPGEIAIICRSVSGRADAIRSTAARMGVPVYVEAARSPATNPAVRAVLQAYEVVAGGYRRADVVDLLRSSYLTLEPLLARHLTADDVACVAAEALVLEGRRQWAERLSALEARLREREEYRASIDDDGMPRPSGTAAALVAEVSASVAALFDILPAHGTGLTRLERVAETRELIAVTRLREGLERPEMRRRASEDIRAIEQLGSALDALEHAREARGPSGGLPPGEYLALLREVLEDLADTPPPPSGERVAVLDARRARQLRFKHCFVMGLNEGEFPRRRRDEPFFSGDDLRALERAGVDLNRRRTPEG